MIKESIDKDIKSAMLSGDKTQVSALRTIKSAILDEEVNSGRRELGLSDEDCIKLLLKEQKKRKESAEVFRSAGDEERAKSEEKEVELIAKYLPEMISEDEIRKIVDKVLAQENEVSMKVMGKIIGLVKAEAGPTADGGLIARIVKESINK